ncbi:MAG: DUF6636 domain-containing protein [Candidatus Phosphoribacter sp.]
MRVPAAPLFVAVLAVLGVAGCGTGGPSAPATTTIFVNAPEPSDAATSGTRPPAQTQTVAVGAAIDATGHEITVFASPSGNIVCAGSVGDAGASAEVRCDVMEHTWTLPPKPADCEFDWSHGTFLDTTAMLSCVSDAIAGSDVVGADGTWWNGQPGSQVVTVSGRQSVALGYGSSMILGPITCTSREDGMHCTNSKTKAGFDINRAGYTLR